MKPLLLGHRGVRPRSRFLRSEHLPAENTLPAFEYALAHGCDGFEFDVRATRDGRLALWHDPKARRLEIATSSYDDLCSAFGGSFPCLEDVLRQFGARAYLDIEVKAVGAEDAVVEALREAAPSRGYVLSSFLPEVLGRLHAVDAALPLGYICERSAEMALWRELPIEVVIPQQKLATPALVDEAHGRGVKVFVWTVNRESDVLRLAEWGVDGIISDDPGMLVRVTGG